MRKAIIYLTWPRSRWLIEKEVGALLYKAFTCTVNTFLQDGREEGTILQSTADFQAIGLLCFPEFPQNFSLNYIDSGQWRKEICSLFGIYHWVISFCLFCIGKLVKSTYKYLSWLSEFGRYSFHFTSYLWGYVYILSRHISGRK